MGESVGYGPMLHERIRAARTLIRGMNAQRVIVDPGYLRVRRMIEGVVDGEAFRIDLGFLILREGMEGIRGPFDPPRLPLAGGRRDALTQDVIAHVGELVDYFRGLLPRAQSRREGEWSLCFWFGPVILDDGDVPHFDFPRYSGAETRRFVDAVLDGGRGFRDRSEHWEITITSTGEQALIEEWDPECELDYPTDRHRCRISWRRLRDQLRVAKTRADLIFPRLTRALGTDYFRWDAQGL